MTNIDNVSKTDEVIKLYKRRWFMLLLFVFTSVVSLMQWIEYSIIADVIVKYYDVSYDAANWASMICLLCYIPFVFMANVVFVLFGLRTGVILASLGTCLGAWIKVLSNHPQRFWVLILGQSIVGISQTMILPTPTLIAATWFGANEVSLACSIGIVGLQLGVAVGFLFPPIVVHGEHSVEDIGAEMFAMSLVVGVVCTANFLIIVLFFGDKPPTPPSNARCNSLKIKDQLFNIQSLLKPLSNRCYVKMLLVYGVYIGIYYAVSIMLNQLVLKYYPNGTEDAGRIGLFTTVAGAMAIIFYGIFLDKFKLFKPTMLVTQFLCCTAMLMFTFTFHQGIVFAYVTSILLGTFLVSLMVTAYEVVIEITYPEPESTTAGLINASAQVFGVIFTYLYCFLFYQLGDIWSNLTFCVILFVGFVLVVVSPLELRRQAVNFKKNPDNCGYINTIEMHM